MKKFLTSLRIFIELYRAGFFFSENKNAQFYRLNYEKNGMEEYGIFDIDHSIYSDGKTFYYNIHGGKENTSLFRVNNTGIKISSR